VVVQQHSRKLGTYFLEENVVSCGVFQINVAANVFVRVPAGKFSAYHGHKQRHIMETLYHGPGWTGAFYVRDYYKLVTLTDLKNKKN